MLRVVSVNGVLSLLLLLLSFSGHARAWQTEDEPAAPEKILGHWGEDTIGFRWTEQDSVDGRWQLTDVGPFLSTSVHLADRTVLKGRVIRVGESGDVLCYDSATGQLESWWQGESLVRFDPARYGLIRHPEPSGAVRWRRPLAPGSDPNAAPVSTHQHRSLLQHGNRVVLSGEDAGVIWHEAPDAQRINDQTVIVRDFQIESHSAPLRFDPGLPAFSESDWQTIGEWQVAKWSSSSFANEPSSGWIAVTGTAANQRWLADHTLEPNDQMSSLRIAMIFEAVETAEENRLDATAWSAMAEQLAPISWDEVLLPGERLWNEELVTSGSIGESRRGLRMDTIQLPFENPWHALMFLSGIDFYDDGRAAICTVHGDVWIVTGLDQELTEVKWRRYATGLFQALGLKIIDGDVFVLGRDQITRLIDRDENGEADEYRCFNNQAPTSYGVHDYAACLETDSQGRLISVRANTGVERFSKDGSSYEVIATGLRNPNGLGVGPDDLITVAPQEGEWTPASAIFAVQEGNHFGYLGPQVTAERPLGYDSPMLWLPRLLDNSCGGQVWLPEQGWGELNGAMIHLSFGRCWPLLVLPESTSEGWQAGAIRLPFECESGVSRGRVQPGSGALFLAGLKGWASSSVMDGCLHRLVPTDDPMTLPTQWQTVADGIVLTFAVPLDRESVQDVGRWSAQQWNYRYSAEYGSADYRPSQPSRPGHDELGIRSATLLDDGQSVFLQMPQIGPVMQLAVSYDIQSSEGEPISDTLYQTIHKVGEEVGPVGEHATQIAEREPNRATARGLMLKLSHAALDGTMVHDARVTRQALLSRDAAPISPWSEGRGLVASFEGWLKIDRRLQGAFVIRGNAEVVLKIGEQSLEMIERNDQGAKFETIELGRDLHPIQLTWSALDEGPLEMELMWEEEGGVAAGISPELWFHDPSEPKLVQANERRLARQEFASAGCRNCHALPAEIVGSAFVMPELLFAAPDLEDLSTRVRADWLAGWLLAPDQIDPTTEMPRLFDANSAQDRAVVADLVAYLVGSPDEVSTETQGSDAAEDLIGEGEALVEIVGCVACHVTSLRPDDDRRSWEGVGAKFDQRKLEAFLSDPAAHHATSKMPKIHLEEQERHAIAAYLLSLSTAAADDWNLPEGNAIRGSAAFVSLGCVQCHPAVEMKSQPIAPAVVDLRLDQGCLSSEASGLSRSGLHGARIPNFRLTAEQRRRLQRLISNDLHSLGRDGKVEVAERMMSQLRCVSCHDRDGQTGRLAEILFDESVQGLSPEWLPSLTWAGDKLRPTWTEEFLSHADRQPLRPWLRARMPAFPSFAQAIAEGLSGSVQQTQAEETTWSAFDPEVAAIGGRLIGAVEGFDCRQCHALAGLPATGDAGTQVALGVDFAEVGRRIRPDYFHRWMRDPLAIDPLTKMPRYSEDGQTTKVGNLLEGNADAQFEAILQFLRQAGYGQSE